MATRPTIEIRFKQLATTLIKRSERGTAILLLKDEEKVEEGIIVKAYKTVADIDNNAHSDDSIAHIKACMAYAPYEVVVISGGTETEFSEYAAEILKARPSGWICAPGNEDMQGDLASWIKSQENADRTYKAIGTKASQNCKHYVYFNQAVTDSEGTPKTAAEYLSSLAGIIASCNVVKGCTNFLCSDLSLVEEVADIDAAIEAGQLVLTNDVGGVRIVTGINSLTTLNGSTATEDMQYIETVEAMDLIRDDIRDEFKNTYQGRFKNKYMNQMLFIGAVNNYFDNLAAEDILDSEFDNKAEIDVEAQRSAWIGAGQASAVDWDDDTVKRRSFKRSVFIAANIKILNCMENLKFTVTME